MIEPLDIAVEMHKICLIYLLPNKLSPPHGLEDHAFTTKAYADAVNAAGLEVTGKQFLDASFAVIGWTDYAQPWPGHPDPDAVVEYLRNNVV